MVVTRPAEDFKDPKREVLPKIFELLLNKGIVLNFQSRIHQKFSIIDRRIVWYGSINMLSYGTSEESIMRIESGHIAGELMRTVSIKDA